MPAEPKEFFVASAASANRAHPVAQAQAVVQLRGRESLRGREPVEARGLGRFGGDPAQAAQVRAPAQLCASATFRAASRCLHSAAAARADTRLACSEMERAMLPALRSLTPPRPS
jgi:hypothetical protein